MHDACKACLATHHASLPGKLERNCPYQREHYLLVRLIAKRRRGTNHGAVNWAIAIAHIRLSQRLS